VSHEIVDACLASDEARACRAADDAGSLATYPATKVAVARWVRRNAPAQAWIGSGITLNALAPGSTATAMTAAVAADPLLGPLSAKFPKPIGRQATAEELGHVAAFLLGPRARAFCGSVIFCDGGTDALLRPDDWPNPPTNHDTRSTR
jgi:NAD(P)-dependent dehydrogenase (short-subunit alcohol dehydrogenase family)